MNNLENLKQVLHSDKDTMTISFFNIAIDDIDNLTPNQVADIINGDCNICLCYGCRQFTRNCTEHITKDECKRFIIDYFSRDFNSDTDNCQCSSCRTRRGEDTDKHYWKLCYKNKECVVCETSLPEAKSLAINKGIYNKEDYPYIVGKINDKVKKEKKNEKSND